MNPTNLSCSRRNLLKLGAGLPFFLQRTNLALAAKPQTHPNRILVVLELSGGNDGLNTVVPYTNDEYYKLRPTLGIKKTDVLKVSDDFGFHGRLFGFERLFKDGAMAVVHGCSYPNPDRSHFVSMGYWQTAVPNGSDSRGWIGRFADGYEPTPKPGLIVEIGKEQAQAVKSSTHSPVVFSDPSRFVREGEDAEKAVFEKLLRDHGPDSNKSLEFVRGISSNAAKSSDFIRNACAEYRSKMEYGYGAIGADLKRVVAMIQAGGPARIYYVSFGSFDTHVSQSGQHGQLFNQLGDAVQGFLMDLKRIGRADDVALMSFTEFGRRVKENASRGTDHGVASPMFIAGAKVKGGFYGKHPSLTDLDVGDLKMSTDFRSVYATMIKEWMGFDDTKSIFYGDYPTLGVFA